MPNQIDIREIYDPITHSTFAYYDTNGDLQLYERKIN